MILFIEIVGMLLIVILLYFLSDYIYDNILNVSDKRNALDHLPVPIYFGMSDKLPLVVNDKMYDLIYYLKGKPLNDISSDFDCLFENHLNMDEVNETLSNKYNSASFVIKDEKVYFIDKKKVNIDDDIITEICGQDITEEYENLNKLKSLNEELKDQNIRLKKHFDNIAIINREQELLNAKISIHAKLGDCIAMTRHLLKDPDDTELITKVNALWQQIILGFSDISQDRATYGSGYEELQRISNMVGCRIIVNGTLPEGEAKPFMIKILREALNNAIRHADANSLTVELNDFSTQGQVIIYDDGTPKIPFTKMGGGLSSLKENLEQNGIIFNIDATNRFKIKLSFPKGLRS